MSYSRTLPSLVAAALAVSLFAQPAVAGEFSLIKNDGGVTVQLDGKLMTDYRINLGPKPILYPVIGPTGKPMTRNYPMKKGVEGERADHPHHRSIFFTHDIVNGVQFWLEDAPDTPPEKRRAGRQVHQKYLKLESGPAAVVSTLNDWVGPQGKKVCEDERTITIRADADSRTIDYDITLKATEGKLVIGDTKEGTMGIRIAGSMKVTADPAGKIVNSEGQTDAGAWGKRANWVDYHGQVEGELLGIAMLNHPTSFRYPTHWHVRTYGLFAANPFGVKAFTKEGDGTHTIPAGGSLTLRHRIVLHKGDENQGKIAERFAAYAKEKK